MAKMASPYRIIRYSEAKRGGVEESMAIHTVKSLLFLLFVSFLSLHLLCFYQVSGVEKDQREFDYFLLALQWPGTICQRTRHCCSSNGCCRSSFPLTEFTIHGLWTDYNDGTWPACCSDSHFDEKKISSLIPTLEKYWPSLSCSSSSLCHGGKGLFWAHEWEKHGTCSYPIIQDEYSYFSTALDLYSKYNITRVLNNAGFLATNGEKYPLGDIVSTIEKAMGASPLLVCSHGQVEELRLCFYKDFKPRDCVIGSSIVHDTANSRSSCPKYISLPTYTPLVLEDETPKQSLGYLTEKLSDLLDLM